MDFNKLTRKELEKIVMDAQRALKKLEKNELRDAKKAAEEAAAKFGFTLSQLVSNARPSGKPGKSGSSASQTSAAKYANPSDPDQTWTGKGRQPQWYKDAIAAGTDPKKLEA